MHEGLATGANYIDRNGREREQTARAVIVCGNGVGTPRLLLLSKSARFPDGLANSSGLVGKNLMMHPYAAVTGYFDEPLESWLGPAGQTIQSMQFYETDATRGFVRGAKWQVMPSGGPLGMRAAYGGKPLEEAWGANLHRNTPQGVRPLLRMGDHRRRPAGRSNQVVLDAKLTDSDGIPAPKLIYKNSDNTRKLIDFHLERAKEATGRGGRRRHVRSRR